MQSYYPPPHFSRSIRLPPHPPDPSDTRARLPSPAAESSPPPPIARRHRRELAATARRPITALLFACARYAIRTARLHAVRWQVMAMRRQSALSLFWRSLDLRAWPSALAAKAGSMCMRRAQAHWCHGETPSAQHATHPYNTYGTVSQCIALTEVSLRNFIGSVACRSH